MKILLARKKLPNFATQYIDVESLFTIPPDAWLRNRSEEFGYDESFEKHGMIYPIAVTDHTPQWVKDRILPKNPQHKDIEGNLNAGYYVHCGNKRVMWARDNGYDKIEAYFSNSITDIRNYRLLTSIKHAEIPK